MNDPETVDEYPVATALPHVSTPASSPDLTATHRDIRAHLQAATHEHLTGSPTEVDHTETLRDLRTQVDQGDQSHKADGKPRKPELPGARKARRERETSFREMLETQSDDAVLRQFAVSEPKFRDMYIKHKEAELVRAHPDDPLAVIDAQAKLYGELLREDPSVSDEVKKRRVQANQAAKNRTLKRQFAKAHPTEARALADQDPYLKKIVEGQTLEPRDIIAEVIENEGAVPNAPEVLDPVIREMLENPELAVKHVDRQIVPNGAPIVTTEPGKPTLADTSASTVAVAAAEPAVPELASSELTLPPLDYEKSRAILGLTGEGTSLPNTPVSPPRGLQPGAAAALVGTMGEVNTDPWEEDAPDQVEHLARGRHGFAETGKSRRRQRNAIRRAVNQRLKIVPKTAVVDPLATNPPDNREADLSIAKNEIETPEERRERRIGDWIIKLVAIGGIGAVMFGGSRAPIFGDHEQDATSTSEPKIALEGTPTASPDGTPAYIIGTGTPGGEVPPAATAPASPTVAPSVEPSVITPESDNTIGGLNRQEPNTQAEQSQELEKQYNVVTFKQGEDFGMKLREVYGDNWDDPDVLLKHLLDDTNYQNLKAFYEEQTGSQYPSKEELKLIAQQLKDSGQEDTEELWKWMNLVPIKGQVSGDNFTIYLVDKSKPAEVGEEGQVQLGGKSDESIGGPDNQQVFGDGTNITGEYTTTDQPAQSQGSGQVAAAVDVGQTKEELQQSGGFFRRFFRRGQA